MGKDTVVIRSELSSTAETPFLGHPEKVKDYFQTSYGACEVIHSAHSPQPSGKIRYIVVLRFTDSPTANRIKQKYNGRVLSGTRVTTSWLEAKQMKELGITESMLYEQQPSRTRSPSPHRSYSRSSGRSSRYHYHSRYSRSPSPTRSSGRNASPTSSRSRKKVIASTSSSNKERSSSQESNPSGYTSVGSSQESHTRDRSRDRSTQDRSSSRTSQLPVKDGKETKERSSSRASNNSTNEMDKSERRSYESHRSSRSKRRYDSEDDFADSETDHATSKKDCSRPPEKKRSREDDSNDKRSSCESTQKRGHEETTLESGRSSGKSGLATHKDTPSEMDVDEDKDSKTATASNEAKKESSVSAKDKKHETLDKRGKTRDASPPSTKRKYHDDSKSSSSDHEHSSKHKHHKKSRTDKKSSKTPRQESVSSAPSEDNASEITKKSTKPSNKSTNTAVSVDTAPASTSETEQVPNVADMSLMIKKELVSNTILDPPQQLPPSSNEGTTAVSPTDPPNYDFDRDETPPAELLEATHHLAQGDYAEWYHWTVKNNPAALQQVIQQLSSQSKDPVENTASDLTRNENFDQLPSQSSPVPTAVSRDGMEAELLQNRIGQQDVADQSLAGPSQSQRRTDTNTFEHMQLQRTQARVDTGSQWNRRRPPYQDYERRAQPLEYSEPAFRSEPPLQSRNDPVFFSRGEPPWELPHTVIPRSAEHPREQPSSYPRDYQQMEQPSMYSRSDYPRRGLLEPQLAPRIEPAREQPLFSPQGVHVRVESPLLRRDEPLMPRPVGNEPPVDYQEPFAPRREALLSPPGRRNPLIGGEPPLPQNDYPPVRSTRYSPIQQEMGFVNRRDEMAYRRDVPLQQREDPYLTRDQQSFPRGEDRNRNDPTFNEDDDELGEGYLRALDSEIQLYTKKQNELSSQQQQQQQQQQQRRQEQDDASPTFPRPTLSMRQDEMWSDEVRREAEIFFKRHELRGREEDESGERRQDDSFRLRLFQQSNLPPRSHHQHSPSYPVRMNPEHLRQSPLFDSRTRLADSLDQRGSVLFSPITPRQNLSISSGDHYHSSPRPDISYQRPDSGLSYRHTTSSDRDSDYPSYTPPGNDGISTQPFLPQKAADSFNEQRYLNETPPTRWNPPHHHHTSPSMLLSHGINLLNVGLTDDDYQNLQRSLVEKRLNSTPVSSEYRPKFSQGSSERSVARPSVRDMVTFRPSPGRADERSLFRPVPITHHDTPPGVGGPSSTQRPIVHEMETIQQSSNSSLPGLESEEHGFRSVVTTNSSLQPQTTLPTAKPSTSDAGVQADIPCSSSKASVAAQTEEVTVVRRPVKRKREKVKKLSEDRRKLACKYRPLQKSMFQECSDQARTLMVAAKMFMKQDPSNSVVFECALQSSLWALSDKLEEKFWSEVERRENTLGQ